MHRVRLIVAVGVITIALIFLAGSPAHPDDRVGEDLSLTSRYSHERVLPTR